MANPEHLAKLNEGVEAWNVWRAESSVIPDLSEASLSRSNLNKYDLSRADIFETDLSGAELLEANLVSADLRKTNLSEANLEDADFRLALLDYADLRAARLVRAGLIVTRMRSANLTDANLYQSDLSQAELTHSKLCGANLTEATLVEANLQKADLTDSEWSGALLGHTIFADNDLSTVTGLATASHVAPSTVGIDTIYRSKGRILESFLRGCGVPDDFITYAKSLVASAVGFYSCFISYSTKDQEFADRLHADLQNKGVRCWFAPHDIQSGKKLHEQIDEAIRLHDKLLLMLSPHSMASEWVKTEIAKARKREVRDQRRVLFPIRLAPYETLRDWECFDADTGKDSAREIREYFIPDFSNWKNHDSYQEAFQRLISDLKASDAKPKESQRQGPH
jgi:hypothetical protein